MKAGLIVAVLIAAAPLVASQERQTSVYRSRSDIVVIDAAVVDGKKPITNLAKADFELRDNGVVQNILDFDHGRMPLDVTMTIDISGSMTPRKRAAVERAVGQVSNGLDPEDRAGVVLFGRAVADGAPLRHPPIALDLSQTGGGTSVFDALLLSLVAAPIPDRRQLNLVMTDGDDTTSYFDEATVVETAKHTAAQMSFVVVRGGGTNADDPVMDAFRAITHTTGGEIIRIDQDDALSEAFLRAIENFRTSYVLRYAPTGVPASGWHEVTVSVKSKRYTVRARKGYWAR